MLRMIQASDQSSADRRPATGRARSVRPAAHERRARRRRRLAWAVFAVSGVLMVNALVGDNGYLATLRARREYDALQASLARTRYENQQLRDQILRMRDDPTALEEVARGQLGLIKPGETVVIVKDPAGSGSGSR